MTAPTISTSTNSSNHPSTTRRSNNGNKKSHANNNNKISTSKVTAASAAVASALNAVNAAMNSIEGGSKKVSSPSRVHSSPSAAQVQSQVQAQAVDSRAVTAEKEDSSDDSRPPVKINLVRRCRSSSFGIRNEDAAAANEQLEKLLAMVDHQDEEDGTKLRAKTNLKNLLLQRIVRHQQHQHHQQDSRAGYGDKEALLDSSNSSRSVNSLSLHQEIELPLDNPFENFHARVPHSEKPASSEQQSQQQQPVLKRVSSFHKQNSHRKFILPEEFVPETPHQLDDSIKRVSFQGDYFDRDDYGYSYYRSFSDDSSSEDDRGSEVEVEEEEKDEEALDRSASSLLSEGTAYSKDYSHGRVLSLQTSCPNFSSSSECSSGGNSDNDNYSKGILKHSSHSGRMVGATKGILKRSQFNRRSSVDHPMISTPNGNGDNIHSSLHHHRAKDEINGKKEEEDLASSMPNLNSHAFEAYNNGFIHPSLAPFKRPQFRPPLTTKRPDTDRDGDGDDNYDAYGNKKSDLARRGRLVTKEKREEPHEKEDDLGMSMDSLISTDSNKTQDTSTASDSHNCNRNHNERGSRRTSHRTSRSTGRRHRSNSTASQGSEVPFKDEIFVPSKIMSPKSHRAGSENRRSRDSGSATGSGGHGKNQNEKQQDDKSQQHRAPSRSRTHRSASDADAVDEKTRSSNSSNDHVDTFDNANATATVSSNAMNTNKEEAIATIRKSKSFVINHHRVGALAVAFENDGTTTRNTAGSEEIVTLMRSKSFVNHDQGGNATAANNNVTGPADEEFATIKKSKSFFNHHLEEITASNSNAKDDHDRGNAMDANSGIITIKKSKSFVNRGPSTTGKSKDTNVPATDANENIVTLKKSKSFIDRCSPTPAEDNRDSGLRRHSSRPRSRGRHQHNCSQAEAEKKRQQRCDDKELNRGTSAGLQNNDDDKKEKKFKSKAASSSKDKRPSHRHRRSSTGAIDNADHENHHQQGEISYNRTSSADNPISRRKTQDASFVAPPPPPRKSSRKSSSGKQSTRRSLSHSASSIPPPPPPPPHPSNTSSSAALSHRRSSADLLTNQAKQMLDGASYQNFDGDYCVATLDNIADPPATETPTSAKARSSSRHRARATSHGPVSTAGAVSANVTTKTSHRSGSEHRSKSRSKRDVLKIAEGKKTWTPDGTNTGSGTTKNNNVANVTPPVPLRNSKSSSSLSSTTTMHQRKSLSPNEVVVTDYCPSFRTAETNTTSSSLESFGAQVEEFSMY
mmetsp:Transcript_25137/g.52969  ORF Transcript_25137/g.52969 Transcript_25137/m.52969 type:complete len:1248 (-) Transcript_25137:234-3977(-)|eukprot:CAMPEP_0171344204 /NCGR_PEP_ID=MMETSP0878-20121228/18875_1 /TAXON_ID=67004 /ORGANISM="Thalassiosira weissflogii, Strain CCMP1336" /LENGTH=1247 /DNA_ID=CAMNT_0011847335 /DNA_START=50 /DNA_END=3793 /DNA_ORIENTATION=+